MTPEKPSNKSVEAALKYLLDQDPEEKEKAFGWLIGICYIACSGLFIPDSHAEYVRIDEAGVKTDNSPHDRQRLFIQEWLLEYFKPLRKLCAEEVTKRSDELRYIGRKCLLSLLNKLRKCAGCGRRKRKECLTCAYVLTHREINNGATACPRCKEGLKKNSKLVCPYGCENPRIYTSLDTSYTPDGDPLSDFVVSECFGKQPPFADWLVVAQPDLEALGLYEGARVFQLALEQRAPTTQVTGIWAETYGIAPKTARKRRQRFLKLIEQHRDNKLVQELYNVILDGFDHAAAPVLVVQESAETKAAREARSAAARMMAEYWKGVSPEARRQAEEEVSRMNEIAASLEEDEIESRNRVSSIPVHRVQEVQHEEERETVLSECTDEEVQLYREAATRSHRT
jgi:hypothetical protein